MKRFIEGENRYQSTLFPESLEDYIAEDNAVRVIDAFVNKLGQMRTCTASFRPIGGPAQLTDENLGGN